MRIINDLNHNDWGSKGNIYECTIEFDSEDQMDRVLENFDSKDIFLDFPEIDDEITITALTKKTHWYGTKKEFLSAVSKEARRANKQK